ncbi:hypothetical protein PV332_40300 [Streptomyces scabiei]|nr:hypothetical protein [Streptomyces scabiei]MDX2581672.1 hypothetical protein [Streptomyces scabiei]MDX2659061.1 hypothetical protein [Streptomyces scabiei]MDX3030708.1 hypothetical protein [Streptomyces scabiei]MDX3050097.1 hypothetical protein [Streptomyces scabiei]MDX3209345.1 hypothetical protein [Streptomyces scabiei]
MAMVSPRQLIQNHPDRESGTPSNSIEVRFLRPGDVKALITLEHAKWDQDQAADRVELAARIQAFPGLSIGAFETGGAALASLFMKPITTAELGSAATWADCARVETPHPKATGSLFGISLSSVDADAVTAIFEFFWPHALKHGWRDIYLGSPMPGLQAWRRANPDMPVEVYMREKRQDLPRDPQLRYYHNKGFKDIVACKSGYFPHTASLDYGAILRGHIPLSAGAPLWRLVPLPWLKQMRRLLFRLV